ncbi:MAG: restriction endonuclease subunit S [Roseburia sp.]|nr:restriction endonuclease subunit S [Roseburia sp.]
MKTLKIQEVANQVRGVSYKPDDLHDSLNDSSVILLRANNIDDGKINFDDVVYVDKSKVSKEQYLKRGDILVCASSGSKQLVGKAASVDFETECTFGAFCKVVRPQEEFARYLGKYFQSNTYRSKISAVAIGANINNIRNEHIDTLDLRVYDEVKNEEIVHVISCVQSIIEHRKQEIKKLDELIKARFVELFGDPITNTKCLETKDLKNVLILKAGDFTAASDISDEPNKTHSYPCYGGNGIRGYVAEYNQDGEYSLVGRQGALSGNVQYAKGKFKNTEHALLVTPIVEMNSIWLNQLLINLDLKRYQTGAAQPGLSVKNLQEIQILRVPITEQNNFADFVTQVDKSKVAVQKALDEAQLLFDSLMQKYFG